MLEHLKLWIELLAVGVEIAAAIVIGLAAIEAMVRALPLFLRRGISQDCGARFENARLFERQPPGEQLVEHHAEGPDVASRVGGFAL